VDTNSENLFSDILDEEGQYRDPALSEYFRYIRAEAPGVSSVDKTRSLSAGHLKDLIVIYGVDTWQSLYNDIRYEGCIEVGLVAQRALEYLFSDQERTEALAQIAEEYPASHAAIAELAPRRDIADDAFIENFLQELKTQAPAQTTESSGQKNHAAFLRSQRRSQENCSLGTPPRSAKCLQ
jgi:hypothetical protein